MQNSSSTLYPLTFNLIQLIPMTSSQVFKKLFNLVLDTIFPQSKLGKQLETITAEELFNSVPKIRHEDRNIINIFSYDNQLIKKAIWSLKFRNKKRLAKIFAEILYDRILEDLNDLQTFKNFTEPLLIPIPVSKKRFRERGYNQCELIAKELCKLDGNNSFILEKQNLIKIIDTPHQSRAKNRKERLENLKDSFRVRFPEKIKSRNIILLDDITTTGTTLREADKILRQNGARKIICLTMAH